MRTFLIGQLAHRFEVGVVERPSLNPQHTEDVAPLTLGDLSAHLADLADLEKWDMAALEAEMVALASANGRRQEAARLLGMGRNTLTRKIKALHLD